MPFRTQPALKKAFEDAFAQQDTYKSFTAFHEDCLRAFVGSIRRGEELVFPVEFVAKQPSKHK